MRRSTIAAAALVAILGVRAETAAADEYTNQIKTAAMMFGQTPGWFQVFCAGIGGKHTDFGDKARCTRGVTMLVIAFEGDTVIYADASYPATPKDVRGLWSAAIKTFGEPDVTQAQRISWALDEGVVASAQYDEQFSAFTLFRSR